MTALARLLFFASVVMVLVSAAFMVECARRGDIFHTLIFAVCAAINETAARSYLERRP